MVALHDEDIYLFWYQCAYFKRAWKAVSVISGAIIICIVEDVCRDCLMRSTYIPIYLFTPFK